MYIKVLPLIYRSLNTSFQQISKIPLHNYAEQREKREPNAPAKFSNRDRKFSPSKKKIPMLYIALIFLLKNVRKKFPDNPRNVFVFFLVEL